MENKAGSETGPAKKRPSYRNIFLSSDSNKETNSSEGISTKLELISQDKVIIVENLEEKDHPQNKIHSLPPPQFHQQNEPECITLSSDEEMEERDLEYQSRSSENVTSLVTVEMADEKVDITKNAENEDNKADQLKRKWVKGSRKGGSNDGLVIARKYSLQEQKQFIGDHQNMEMKRKQSLVQHIRTQHKSPKGSFMFKCETCGKEMISKYVLKIHQATHNKDFLFGCYLCQIKFKRQFYLDKHLKSNEHKNAETLHKIIENKSSVENCETGLTPSSPFLLEKMSPKLVARKSEIVEGSQLKTSPPAETRYRSDSKYKSTSSFSMPQIQSSTYASPKPIMELSPLTTSGGLARSTMTHNLYDIHTPLLNYEYMIQSYEASCSRNVFPPVLQATQYPASFYSGIATPQTMKRISKPNPHKFTGYSKQPSVTTFTCLKCKARFNVEAHFHSHMQNAHSNDCWKCTKCFDVMLSPEKFQQHFSKCVGL